MSRLRYHVPPGSIIAYCWADGKIGFTRQSSRDSQSIPEGTLPIVGGPVRMVRSQVTATARIAYDGKTLLVPGIPEAQMMGNDPLNALRKHRDWLLKRPGLHMPTRITSTKEAA